MKTVKNNGKGFKNDEIGSDLNKLGLLDDISVNNVEPAPVKNIPNDAVQNAVLMERNRVNDLEAMDEKNNPAVTAIIIWPKKKVKL